MKVLKKGTGQKGWSMRATCTGAGNKGGGCGAELLVEQDDVFLTYSHHYDGSSEVYRTFKCSQCTVLTDIPSSIHLPFTPRKPRKADSGATYTGSSGAGIEDDEGPK